MAWVSLGGTGCLNGGLVNRRYQVAQLVDGVVDGVSDGTGEVLGYRRGHSQVTVGEVSISSSSRKIAAWLRSFFSAVEADRRLVSRTITRPIRMIDASARAPST